MMTYVVFAPTPTAPFQFQATLDGALYTLIVTWNFAGQRWYVNCYTQDSALVFCLPMIGSPGGYDISMTAGYFASTLVYRVGSNQFEISP